MIENESKLGADWRVVCLSDCGKRNEPQSENLAALKIAIFAHAIIKFLEEQ